MYTYIYIHRNIFGPREGTQYYLYTWSPRVGVSSPHRSLRTPLAKWSILGSEKKSGSRNWILGLDVLQYPQGKSRAPGRYKSLRHWDYSYPGVASWIYDKRSLSAPCAGHVKSLEAPVT